MVLYGLQLAIRFTWIYCVSDSKNVSYRDGIQCMLRVNNVVLNIWHIHILHAYFYAGKTLFFFQAKIKEMDWEKN